MQKTCHYAIDLNMRLMWLKKKNPKKENQSNRTSKKTQKGN